MQHKFSGEGVIRIIVERCPSKGQEGDQQEVCNINVTVCDLAVYLMDRAKSLQVFIHILIYIDKVSCC